MEQLKIVKVNFKHDYLDLEIADEDKNKIEEIRIKMKKPFRIPLYQRPYEWKENHVEALVKDIEYNEKNHFIGNIVVEEKDDCLDVIDGQQRLTTLYLLCKIAGKEYFKLEYEVREEAKKFLEEEFALNC